MGDMSFADVEAGVRTALATYSHALDDGRAEDVVATFCSDGAVDIPGMGTHAGAEALLAAYTRWRPRQPQRHLVVNTAVTDWGDDRARATSDVVFLLKGEAGWAVQVVGRYLDELHRDGDTGSWRFHRRTAEFVP
jgi:hypothetical protein